MTELLVAQGDNCVVILATGHVMTADEADLLAVALVRAADRSRIGNDQGRTKTAGACPACTGTGDEPGLGHTLRAGCAAADWTSPPPQYRCNCGRVFDSHLARTAHAAACPVMLGTDVL